MSTSGMAVICECCLFISVSIHSIVTYMHCKESIVPTNKKKIWQLYTDAYSPFSVCIYSSPVV